MREADWQVAPTPADLQDRRVEITGPCDRKMVINALNSGAKVFMADLEDASSPTWHNVVDGQQNLYDAVRRTITFANPDGREYRLNPETATLLVRPRGWHLDERHMTVDGEPVSGSLFDFGLYFFHNAKELIERGTGPYFYLPKLQSHREARLWNDVFNLRPGRARHSARGRFAPPCWSRRCRLPSRWTRSSTSCVTTPRGSTPAAGITSSAPSRLCTTATTACCPTGRR